MSDTTYTTIRDLTHLRIANDLLRSVQPEALGIEPAHLGLIRRQLNAWIIEIENKRAVERETP